MSFSDNNEDINNETNKNLDNKNIHKTNLNLLINSVRIKKPIENGKNNGNKRMNKSMQYKKNKKNVTIKIPLTSKRNSLKNGENKAILKEEEKNNYSNNISTINTNKSSFVETKIKPNNVIKQINILNKANFFVRTNKKTYTIKKVSSYNINNKLDKEKEVHLKEFRRLKTIDPVVHLNNTKPMNKKLLLAKLKEILEEIEKENLYANNNDKKSKKKKKLKDMSYLFLERSVKPVIPFIKNRAQLNKYLINDFKENESYQDYIKRSLKYKIINENYEIAQMIKKETNQIISLNQIAPPITEYRTEKEKDHNSKNISILNNSLKYQKKRTFNVLTPQFGGKLLKRNSILSDKNINEENSNKSMKTKTTKYFSTNLINNYQSRLSDIKKKKSKKYILLFNKEEKQKDNKDSDSFLENDILSERPKKKIFKKNTENFSSEKALIKANNSLTSRMKKHHFRHKKQILFYDKYTLSNDMYNEQKKYFEDYLMNKRIIRSKNFSEQMSNLAKEKDLYVINVEENGRLPKLKEGSLIYQMKLKSLFKNSFNPITNFKEGDDDLDLDNLKKIKNSVMETEIEMFSSLKNEINPKYIKSSFNKTTIGKYHSTRGVYFGSK